MEILEQEYSYYCEERKRLEKCLENISSEIGYLQDSIYTYDFFERKEIEDRIQFLRQMQYEKNEELEKIYVILGEICLKIEKKCKF